MALLKTKEAITGECQAEIKVEAVYRNHEWGDQWKKRINHWNMMDKEINKMKRVFIGMPVSMDNISAVRDAEENRQGIRNCRKMETLKKSLRCKYLGIVINTEGNLNYLIQEMGQKSCRILSEINAIGAGSQVWTEKISVKLKCFETCHLPAMLHGLGP